MEGKKLGVVNSVLKCLLNEVVCLSVCLTFISSADARNFNLMTLFFFSVEKTHFLLYSSRNNLITPTAGTFLSFLAKYSAALKHSSKLRGNWRKYIQLSFIKAHAKELGKIMP